MNNEAKCIVRGAAPLAALSVQHRQILRAALVDYQADWHANSVNDPERSAVQIAAAQELLDQLDGQPPSEAAPAWGARAVPILITSANVARRIRDNWRRGYKGTLQFSIYIPELEQWGHGWSRPDNPLPFEDNGDLAGRMFNCRPVQDLILCASETCLVEVESVGDVCVRCKANQQPPLTPAAPSPSGEGHGRVDDRHHVVRRDAGADPLGGVVKRPGGWVPGIGWVANSRDVPVGSRISWYCGEDDEDAVDHDDLTADGQVCIVTRWADGSTPEAES